MWKYTLNPKSLLASDEYDRAIHFNDTEENMMNGFDEGYNVGVNIGN